jgi:hypothetical protein
VAAQHGFAPTLASQPTYAPVSSSNAELLSHNDTHLLSPQTTINENHSVNLDFSGFTMGDKTTAQGSGAVAIGGDNSGDIITGEGSALGNNNHVNNGHLNAGPGSVVNLGEGDVIVDPTPPSAGLPSTHPADPGGLHPIDPSVLHPTTWGTSNPIDPSHLQSTTAPHVRDLEHTKLEEADLRSHVDPAPHVPSPHVPLPDPLNPVDPLHIFS